MSQIQDVFAFNRLVGNTPGTVFRINFPLLNQAIAHCQEELNEELIPASQQLEFDFESWCDGEISTPSWAESISNVADGAIDLMYVAANVLYALGVNAEACWEAVQKANMAKAPGGVVKRAPGGKVLKPEGWQPPHLAD